jgi:hypothetical protein
MKRVIEIIDPIREEETMPKKKAAKREPKVKVDPAVLEYYMTLPYSILLTPMPAEDGKGWYVEIPELKGCMSDSETLEKALEMLEHAKLG